MITVETQISGEQIARQLVQDEEEFARALVEMREVVNDARETGAELAGHLMHSDICNIVTFLRELADGMEEKSCRRDGGEIMSALQRLRSAREAAAYYGVSTSTLWRWVQQGLIPEPIRIGGRTFWEPEALKQHTVSAREEADNRKQALAEEMLKIAEVLGVADDPFAAGEKLSALLRGPIISEEADKTTRIAQASLRARQMNAELPAATRATLSLKGMI